MKRSKVLESCSQALDDLLNEWAEDRDMTVVEAVGLLTIKAHELTSRALEYTEEEV